MSYFFATPVDIDIVLDDADERSMVDVKLDKNRREKAPLYMDGESVKGAVTVRPKDGKRLEHTGIKVQFIGTIGMDGPTDGRTWDAVLALANMAA
jgi:vacuolar protein sorting-associated protein 26